MGNNNKDERKELKIPEPTYLEKKVCGEVLYTTYLSGLIHLYWLDFKNDLVDMGAFKHMVKRRYNTINEGVQILTGIIDDINRKQSKTEKAYDLSDKQCWGIVEELASGIDSNIYLTGIDKSSNILIAIIKLIKDKHRYITETAGFLRHKEFDDSTTLDRVCKFVSEFRSSETDVTPIIANQLAKFNKFTDVVGSTIFDSNCKNYKIIKNAMHDPTLSVSVRRECRRLMRKIDKQYFGITVAEEGEFLDDVKKCRISEEKEINQQ